MHSSNRKSDFFKTMAWVAEALGQEWSPARSEGYWLAHQDLLENADFKKLAEAIIRDFEWIPKGPEFRQLLKVLAKSRDPDAIEDVNWLLTLCERYEDCSDEVLHQNLGPYLGYVFETLLGLSRSSLNAETISSNFWQWVETVSKYREDHLWGRTSHYPRAKLRNHANNVKPFKLMKENRNDK